MKGAIALAIAASLPAVAAAQMYKWVDEKGLTDYSETPPAEKPGDVELRRLTGEWKTATGQSVRFTMAFQLFGSSVKFSFLCVGGGVTQVNSWMGYDFEGGNGQGRFDVEFPPTSELDVRMTPTRIDYRLRGDVLEATVTSSVFAGSCSLRQ